MNNQFILNNEPRKHCHLENLGSILLLESLVWLCHSDAEGRHPFQRPQAVTLSQQGGWSKTTQANFSDSGFSSDSRALGGHMSFLVSPALHDKWCVALWSLDTFKIPIYWFLLLCASSSLTNLLMARIYKVLMERGPSNFS